MSQIEWSGCKKGTYTGLVESPVGVVEFNVQKSLGGMHFKAKLGSSVISCEATLEDAKEKCQDYFDNLKL